MDFGEVLTKAWKIIWKYKILWLFGIFAGCTSGGSNGGGSSVQYTLSPPSGSYNNYNAMNNIEPWIMMLFIGGVILFTLLMIIIVVAVSTIGRIGLTQGTKMADEDEDAKLTFSSIFNNSKPFFWRVVGLNLLIMVGYFALIMVLVMVYFFGTIFTLGLALICLLPLCCVIIPIFWVLATFVEMANAAVVVDDLSIIEGLQRGWEIFKNNLGNMIVMGLILVLGSMIAGIILAMPMFLLMIPLMMSIYTFIVGDAPGFASAGMITTAVCCVAYLPVLIVMSGIIRAYVGSAWTLTYLRLTQGPAVEEPAALLLPDKPVDPEPQPQAVEENSIEEVTETEEPKESEDSLPDDF